jgi:hypothetical protein
VLGGGAWRYCVDDRAGRPRGKFGCEVELICVGREPLRVTWVFRESPLPRRWRVGFTEPLEGRWGLGDSDWTEESCDNEAGVWLTRSVLEVTEPRRELDDEGGLEPFLDDERGL